eukprot:scaffold48039_cov85-Phaeocystis_antarctica.AAC.2
MGRVSHDVQLLERRHDDLDAGSFEDLPLMRKVVVTVALGRDDSAVRIDMGAAAVEANGENAHARGVFEAGGQAVSASQTALVRSIRVERQTPALSATECIEARVGQGPQQRRVPFVLPLLPLAVIKHMEEHRRGDVGRSTVRCSEKAVRARHSFALRWHATAVDCT